MRNLAVNLLLVVILGVGNSHGGRAGWEDSSEDLQYLQHLYNLHHLHRDRILASPSQQMEIRARRPDHPPDHIRVKKNLADGRRNKKVGRRRRRLVRKMRLVTDPNTQYDRTNIVRKLVPKVDRRKEELMDEVKWYDNWVPMTLEQYEESYQAMQRRADTRPPGRGPGRKKPRPRAGPPPPKPAARPVLSSYLTAPGPRRPDHPPPGHEDKTKDNTKDNTKEKTHQEKNNETKKPAQDGLFVPLSFTEEDPSPEQVVETLEGNISELPVVEEISNDIESLFSSETEAERKPKREYSPQASDSEPPALPGFFTSDHLTHHVSPTTAPPLKSHFEILLNEPSIEPQSQVDSDFYKSPASSVTPSHSADLVFQEHPELGEEDPSVHNRRQAFLGHQIPILSQTTEMNQDQAHSFVFDFKTGNGISRNEHGGIQKRLGMAQAGSWQYTAPNGESSVNLRVRRGGGYQGSRYGQRNTLRIPLGLGDLSIGGPQRLNFSLLRNPSIRGPRDISIGNNRDLRFRLLRDPSIRGPRDISIGNNRDLRFSFLRDFSIGGCRDCSIGGPRDLRFSILRNPSIGGPSKIKIGGHRSQGYH